MTRQGRVMHFLQEHTLDGREVRDADPCIFLEVQSLVDYNKLRKRVIFLNSAGLFIDRAKVLVCWKSFLNLEEGLRTDIRLGFRQQRELVVWTSGQGIRDHI